MLSSQTPADVVTSTRERFRTGALLCCDRTVLSISYLEQAAIPAKAFTRPGGAVSVFAEPVFAEPVFAEPAFARPQVRKTAVLIGSGAQAAGKADYALQQRTSKVNYAHTTRIAALMGGGSLGPHPARDPV